jgi:hypothetical protein
MFSIKGFRERGVDALFIRNVEKYLFIFISFLFCYGIIVIIKKKITK